MHLENFTETEFGEHYAVMSQRLLVMLDLWRYRIGSPVDISPVDGALARYLGHGSQSEHNVNFWNECLAADVFARNVWTRRDTDHAVRMAVECGFTGIGVYADTRNAQGADQVMFHLGVRPTYKMGSPATWGRVGHKFTSLQAAIAELPGDH